MKVLFLPNWEVPVLEHDDDSIQAPNKYVKGKPYWFFRYFPAGTEVDIIDYQKNSFFHSLERKVLRIYIRQAILAFRKRKQYDVVISHGAPSGLFFSLLRYLFRSRSPRHYIFDIGGINGGRSGRLETTILKFMLRSNPFIICHSRVIIDNYKKTYKNLIDRSLYVPFGVDTDYFSPLASGESDEKYILSFGQGARDYKTLLKAWEELGRSDIKLRIIGNDPELERPLPPHVEYLKRVPVKTLIEQINHSLYVVLPLPVFNFSYAQMSFLQSMSIGKTVVVTKTPSSVDYLTDYQGSFFVEPYDVQDLKEKMRFLLENPDVLKDSDSKARPHILQHYTEKRMGEKIAGFILSGS